MTAAIRRPRLRPATTTEERHGIAGRRSSRKPRRRRARNSARVDARLRPRRSGSRASARSSAPRRKARRCSRCWSSRARRCAAGRGGRRPGAEDVREQAEATAAGKWDKLEQVFEDRVSRSLNRLGVLTRTDVDDLARQVARAERERATMMRDPPGRRLRAPREAQGAARRSARPRRRRPRQSAERLAGRGAPAVRPASPPRSRPSPPGSRSAAAPPAPRCAPGGAAPEALGVDAR